MLAQAAALHRDTRQVCLFSEVQGQQSPNALSLTSELCNIMYSHPLFLKAVYKKTLWPWRNILKQFLRCKVFSLKPNLTESPVHMEGTVRCRVAQWHKWVFVLPCGSYIISRLQLQHWLLKGLVGDPHGTLDPTLNPPDFYLSHRSCC